MPIFNSHTGQQIASPNMAGLFLCVDGNANLLINGISHQFSRGSMCIISPFLFVEIFRFRRLQMGNDMRQQGCFPFGGDICI
jgi:hypothetical protein